MACSISRLCAWQLVWLTTSPLPVTVSNQPDVPCNTQRVQTCDTCCPCCCCCCCSVSTALSHELGAWWLMPQVVRSTCHPCSVP
jgi:hypothetical protein